MKVLSLKQPYAELVVSGKKTIELRNWNTKFRGKFLIHASLSPDKEGMKEFGFEKLSTGVIVGETELVDVKHYKNSEEHQKDKSKHLANDSWGNYGFILKNAKRLKPISAKGKLNFWNFDYGN
jgi:hypothetical protein